MPLLHTRLSGEVLQLTADYYRLLCNAQHEAHSAFICTSYPQYSFAEVTSVVPPCLRRLAYAACISLTPCNMDVNHIWQLPSLPQSLYLYPQVTKIKLKQKQKEGIAEARSGRRSPVSFLTFLAS